MFRNYHYCVMMQKSAVLSYLTAEAWNQTSISWYQWHAGIPAPLVLLACMKQTTWCVSGTKKSRSVWLAAIITSSRLFLSDVPTSTLQTLHLCISDLSR